MKQKEDFVEKLSLASAQLGALVEGLNSHIIGQKKLTETLCLALLSEGHVLIEGYPGLAKTMAVKTLASLLKAKFNRIQFTPDMLPSDITGTMIYNIQKSEFEVKKGPVFADFVLADEINRAPSKVQSALLEAMQEKQVTIGNNNFDLSKNFLVLATQNPIEQEGTYPLPEAQLDRFLFKVLVSYPSKGDERNIIRSNLVLNSPAVQMVMTLKEIGEMKDLIGQIYLDDKIEDYILNLVEATRDPIRYNLGKIENQIALGVSPRAGIGLAKAARARAFMLNRTFVLPEDVKFVFYEVFRHRLVLSYEAMADNTTVDEVLQLIQDKVPVI